MPCSPREGTLLLLLPKVGLVVGVPTFTDPGIAGNHDRLLAIFGVTVAKPYVAAGVFGVALSLDLVALCDGGVVGGRAVRIGLNDCRIVFAIVH